MRVILLENIASLGSKGDIKDVSDGYANNFLLPQGKVALATHDHIERFKAQVDKAVIQQEEQVDNYQKVVRTLNKQSLSFTAKASDKNILFQGISTQDIVGEIKNKFNLEVNAKWFVKPAFLKEIGRHTVYLRLPDNQLISFFINIHPVE